MTEADQQGILLPLSLQSALALLLLLAVAVVAAGLWLRRLKRRLGRQVAEREAAEASLRQSEERYRLLADHASDMIVHTDLAGNALYVSPSSRTLLGYDPDELGRRMLLSLVHPEDQGHLEAALKKRQAGFEATQLTYRMLRKDGVYLWVEGAVRLIRNQAGKPAGHVAVVRDVSLRKEAEERAASASRAKSEFLTSMSHELRTPLNAVLGFSQLLLYSKGQILSDKQRESVENILRGGNQLLELVNDVLDLAKIEAGKLTVSLETVSIADVMVEAKTLLEPLARQQGLDFSLEPVADRIPVRADRARLAQVLLNLGSNAIKYNRPRGSVRLSAERLPGGWARILVTDTGIGIAAENHPKVFEPFRRFGAEQRAIDGTGIGLSISKRLVDLMGGVIGFASGAGEGSRFWVDLAEAGAEESRAEALGAFELDPLALTQPSFSVLYIDDNPASIGLMTSLLGELENVRVLTAPLGVIGVELAIAHRPDIIIVDIQLPDINGYEVLSRLKAAPETRTTPVLALSGDAMPHDVERGRKAGFVEYLTKPFRVTELIGTLERVLARAPKVAKTDDESATRASTTG